MLFKAIKEENLYIIKLLVRNDADINAQNEHGNTPIMLTTDKPEIFKYLLQLKPDLNIQNDSGNTALMWAAYIGKYNIVKLLLEAGAKVDLKNNSGNAAITWSSSNGHLKITKLLLKYGAEMGDTIIKEEHEYTFRKIIDEHQRRCGNIRLYTLNIPIRHVFKNYVTFWGLILSNDEIPLPLEMIGYIGKYLFL